MMPLSAATSSVRSYRSNGSLSASTISAPVDAPASAAQAHAASGAATKPKQARTATAAAMMSEGAVHSRRFVKGAIAPLQATLLTSNALPRRPALVGVQPRSMYALGSHVVRPKKSTDCSAKTAMGSHAAPEGRYRPIGG